MTVNVKLFDSPGDIAIDAGGALDRAQQPGFHNRIASFEMTSRHCDAQDKPPLVARAVRIAMPCYRARPAFSMPKPGQLVHMGLRHRQKGKDDGLVAAMAEELKGPASITVEPVATPSLTGSGPPDGP